MADIQFTEKASAPSTPTTGDWKLYFKAGGLYTIDDAGTETLLGAGGGGDATGIALTNATELTIATGAVTKTQTYHSIDTEGDAASDDLDTISGGTAGEVLYLFAINDTRTVVLKNGTGNILTYDGNDISLDEDHKVIELIYDGTNWRTVGVISAGGGGGMTSFTAAGDSGGGQAITDGNTLTIAGGTGITTADSVTDTVTVNIDSTVATLTGSQTLTNKTINGTNNTITNIGHAEIEADLINGATVENTIDTANDTILFFDNSAVALRKTAITNIQGAGGGGGLYASVAIFGDEKTTGTGGGTPSATTWNQRNLNTEYSDTDSIVTIASNQFTPVSGTYEIFVTAPGVSLGGHRLRLYNVTGTTVVQEGASSYSAGTSSSTATLSCIFTANGTDAYRIDHYTVLGTSNGLGNAVSDGSPEIYTVAVLRKFA